MPVRHYYNITVLRNFNGFSKGLSYFRNRTCCHIYRYKWVKAGTTETICKHIRSRIINYYDTWYECQTTKRLLGVCGKAHVRLRNQLLLTYYVCNIGDLAFRPHTIQHLCSIASIFQVISGHLAYHRRLSVSPLANSCTYVRHENGKWRNKINRKKIVYKQQQNTAHIIITYKIQKKNVIPKSSVYYLSTHRYKNKTVDSQCLFVCLLFVYLLKMQSFTQNHLHTHTHIHSIMQVFIVEMICDQNNKINSKYTHTKRKGIMWSLTSLRVFDAIIRH